MRHLLVPVFTTLIVASIIGVVATQGQAKGRLWYLYSDDLGVTTAQFKGCFSAVVPDADHRPTSARQQSNKAILLPCLQAANPEITNASLDAVMDRYRPEGATLN